MARTMQTARPSTRFKPRSAPHAPPPPRRGEGYAVISREKQPEIPSPTLPTSSSVPEVLKRMTRSMAARADSPPASAPLLTNAPNQPLITIENFAQKIFDPKRPIQSEVADTFFNLPEMVEAVAKSLEGYEIAALQRLNRTWYGIVNKPSIHIRRLLGSHSDKEILDIPAEVHMLRDYEYPGITLNPLIFHTPGDDGQESGFLRSSPLDLCSSHDPRLEVFLSDPPITKALVEFELYYTVGPSAKHAAGTVLVSGCRKISNSLGIRYKDIRQVFIEERDKIAVDSGRVCVDILRSRISIFHVDILGAPIVRPITMESGPLPGFEMKEMPNVNSVFKYRVQLNGVNLETTRSGEYSYAMVEGCNEKMKASVDDQ